MGTDVHALVRKHGTRAVARAAANASHARGTKLAKSFMPSGACARLARCTNKGTRYKFILKYLRQLDSPPLRRARDSDVDVIRAVAKQRMDNPALACATLEVSARVLEDARAEGDVESKLLRMSFDVTDESVADMYVQCTEAVRHTRTRFTYAVARATNPWTQTPDRAMLAVSTCAVQQLTQVCVPYAPFKIVDTRAVDGLQPAENGEERWERERAVLITIPDPLSSRVPTCFLAQQHTTALKFSADDGVVMEIAATLLEGVHAVLSHGIALVPNVGLHNVRMRTSDMCLVFDNTVAAAEDVNMLLLQRENSVNTSLAICIMELCYRAYMPGTCSRTWASVSSWFNTDTVFCANTIRGLDRVCPPLLAIVVSALVHPDTSSRPPLPEIVAQLRRVAMPLDWYSPLLSARAMPAHARAESELQQHKVWRKALASGVVFTQDAAVWVLADDTTVSEFCDANITDADGMHPLCALLYMPVRHVITMSSIGCVNVDIARCVRAMSQYGGSFAAAVRELCATLPAALGLRGDLDRARSAARKLLTTLVF
jgi:hypothetical protein